MTYPLQLQRVQAGQIDVPGEEHRYLMDVAEEAELELTFRSTFGDGKLAIRLVGPRGGTLLHRVVDRNTPEELLSHMLTLREPGSYEVRVTGVGDDTGGYQLVALGAPSPQIVAHSLQVRLIVACGK